MCRSLFSKAFYEVKYTSDICTVEANKQTEYSYKCNILVCNRYLIRNAYGLNIILFTI